MAVRALLQILAGLRLEEIDRVAAAVLLVGHGVAVGRIGLEVVDAGDGLRRRAKCRMRGDIVDPLAADIDHAAVAQRFQMLLARAQHGEYPD